MSSGRGFIDPEGRRIAKIFVMDGEHVSGKLDNVFSDNQDVYYDGISNRHEVEIYKGFYDPGNKNIFSSGHVVTYYADINNIVELEIDDGSDCIENAPIVTKSGWEFVGWREDVTASADVLSTRTCDADGISLYAVYKVSVTVSLIGGTQTLYNSGNKYYNNGNYANPRIILGTAVLSGWTLVGYRTDTIAASTVSYRSGTEYTFSENASLYAVFHQQITLSYNGNGATGGSTAGETKSRYYNNGNFANPSFTLRANGYSRTNYIFAQWAMGSGSGTRYNAGATVTLASNTTFYAYWVAASQVFNYTGGIQSFTAAVAGVYTFEVWGAQGGGNNDKGGNGGYAKGNVRLTENQTVYVCVGGKGGAGSGERTDEPSGNYGGAGGYNGGAGGSVCQGIDYQERDTYCGGGGGGGATHIGKANAVLSSTPVGDLYIAAGGGGGSIDNYPGGTGGGTTGGGDHGGTQTTGGGLDAGYGQGSSRIKVNWQGTEYDFNSMNGGGGGYYGGGGAGWDVTWSASAGSNEGGGGGSGYIGGCISGTTSMSNGAREGNGYAKITYVSA